MAGPITKATIRLRIITCRVEYRLIALLVYLFSEQVKCHPGNLWGILSSQNLRVSQAWARHNLGLTQDLMMRIVLFGGDADFIYTLPKAREFFDGFFLLEESLFHSHTYRYTINYNMSSGTVP